MASDSNSVATAAEKRKKALDLRRAGWSFEGIATEVGYANKGSAHRAVKQGIAAITRESATELLELELSRLDRKHVAAPRRLADGAARGLMGSTYVKATYRLVA